MLHKSTFASHLLQNLLYTIKIPVRHSALFINGLKATDTYVFVTPHVDYTAKIKNKEIIKNELQRRKSNFDINKLENIWTLYEELNQKHCLLNTKKSETAKELTNLLKNNPESDEANKLKMQAKLIKDNIKMLKIPLWSMENNAMVEALKLPNTLHPNTPDKKHILYIHKECPSSKKSHLDFGLKLDILCFIKNQNYYLKGDAAIFELGAKFHFSNKLKQHNYVQFSNIDFVKSVVVEGCGKDHTSSDCTFILHHNEDTKVNVDSRLHLTGAGSLCSFFAYHTNNVIYQKYLPLCYFSIGRQYNPSKNGEENLFQVSQASVIEVFGVTKDGDEQEKVLNKLIGIVKDFYIELDYHFRLTLVPAYKLHMWESSRVGVEMFSTSLQEYIEVANISVSGDFISKRLMFTYIENKQTKFPYIISGTIINVPKLLACILEQDGDFEVPNNFKVENWKYS